MKKLILALTLFFSFMFFSKTVHAETTVLPPNPITNIRLDTNLKNNAEVTLNNLNMVNSRLYTIVDNDKKLYFCLDESKYYPTGNDYQANLNEKLPSSVLWLMETFYQNQGKIEDVENVPAYKDANELTRYAAIQIVIWKFTGGKFDDKLLTSNPIVNELYTEAKTKPADDHSYQEMIDRLNNVEINATEITPHGEDGDNYLYQLQFEDNLDAETEKLFKIDSDETNINVQLYKNSTIVNITNDITIVDDYNDRTISMEIPKKIIDDNPSEDASIYLNIDTALVTRQPYYLVFGTTGFVQPIGGYQPIKKILTTRASVDLNTSNKSFSVLKHWEDNNNQDGKRPETLKVQLYQSDSPYEYTNTEAVTSGNEDKFGDIQVLNKENGWEYIWANLPAENDKGEKFYYTAREDLDENSGYNLTIKDTDNGNAILLTNSNDPEKINLTGTKNWDDNNNQDGIRPNNILINLLADGEAVQTVTTNENLGWGYEFNDLPKYKDGKEIVYTVSEQEVPGYSTVIDGSMITNTHIPELTEIGGQKIWDDANNKDGIRPESITVNLLADGTKVDSKIVTQKENWTYQFTNLPKYNEGHEIVYTVTENSVPDYSTQIDGTTITNSYTPGETSITVTKAWNDNNNQDGIRPEDIKVQLFANGEKVNSPISLNNSNNWTTTWNNLPEKEGGKAIEYTVKEVDKLDGYDVSINNSNDGDIIITNTHIPEITEVSGKKFWDDTNNKDGIRPESITVNLLADGSKIDSKEISEKENWTYQFTNLPKYNEGHEIVYTVTENSVPDYSTKIEGTTITNSYTPGKTSVTVTKAWNDSNNQDGLRPNKITVQLYADGKKSGNPVELSEVNNWSATWDDLALKQNGSDIIYSIKEVGSITGYTTTVDNSNKGNIIITNSHDIKGTSNSHNAKGTPTNTPDKNFLSKLLPKTGESYNYMFSIVGILILLIVGVLYYFKNKKS
ncbi:Cna B-type domain-containing protein [Enterococcus sp. AZ163]|uniref:Cna B-type domain-containing protein n=1 Tax=Enterococcus sp. AZ163 TaxID=2774638 RepID=UPI003D2D56C0